MADYEIKYPLAFSGTVGKLASTDRAHADTFNQIFCILLNNEVFLKAVCDLAKTHMENIGMHVSNEQKASWDAKAGAAVATPTANGQMAAQDKAKLNTVQQGAEVNQNAYCTVKVGNVSVTANGKKAEIELVAGNHVNLSADNATKRITIAIPNSLPAAGGRADSAGYADTAGNANKLLNMNWSWSGQGGQPTWIWGGSDGANMYVYNPANFSVAGAASAATINGQTTAPVAIQEAAPATNCLWVW